RARGMTPGDAEAHAREVLERLHLDEDAADGDHEGIGSAWGAAISSFVFFAVGAAVPVIPYAVGADGFVAVAIASAAVGVALLVVGALVGLLSGGALARRALRQLLVGLGAAAVTYVLGSLFGGLGT